MADSERRSETPRFEVKPDAPTHFAWLCTHMSMERMLMSWVRTATALIGFGFTIFQFLYRFNTGSTRHRGSRRPNFLGRPGFSAWGSSEPV